MPWFHVDDGFHSHPKALATSLSARGLWVTAGSWSSAHLTGGVVPDRVLASLGGSPELAAELVAAGLWKRVRSGYQFHEWNHNGNPSKEAVEKERKAAAERQRRHRSVISARQQNTPVDNTATGTQTQQNSTSEARASRRDTAVSNAVSSPALTRSSYRTSNAARSPADAARGQPQKPPWCGMCDRQTRLTGPDDKPHRCMTCHPLIERY